jgi:opacity protein-like surface antigen
VTAYAKATFAVTMASMLLAASTSTARENEHHIGVDVGGSLLDIADKSSASLGAGLGAHYVYGLTDQFNLLGEGSASFVSLKEDADDKTPHTRPTTVSHVAVGIAYTLDVMTLVPYFGILGGGFVMGGGTLDHTMILPGGQLALGADYKLSRHWSVGLAFRQTMFLTKTSTYPSYSNLFARVEYVWGW